MVSGHSKIPIELVWSDNQQGVKLSNHGLSRNLINQAHTNSQTKKIEPNFQFYLKESFETVQDFASNNAFDDFVWFKNEMPKIKMEENLGNFKLEMPKIDFGNGQVKEITSPKELVEIPLENSHLLRWGLKAVRNVWAIVSTTNFDRNLIQSFFNDLSLTMKKHGFEKSELISKLEIVSQSEFDEKNLAEKMKENDLVFMIVHQKVNKSLVSSFFDSLSVYTNWLMLKTIESYSKSKLTNKVEWKVLETLMLKINSRTGGSNWALKDADKGF